MHPIILILAQLILLVPVTKAQIYAFDEVPVPEPRSLHTLYAFYVYAQEDAPIASSHPAVVKFSQLQARATIKAGKTQTPATHSWTSYHGIQLALLPYADFWKLVDPKKFCCTGEDVLRGACAETDQLLLNLPASKRKGISQSQGSSQSTQSRGQPAVTRREVNQFLHHHHHHRHHSVTTRRLTSSQHSGTDVISEALHFPEFGDAPLEAKRVLNRTGVYILVVSNCGDFADATISGRLIVRNPYGFLPGNEYYKMPFYGIMALAYVGMVAGWMLVLLHWRGGLLQIQKCIGVVVLCALLEASLTYAFLISWNATGVRSKSLFTLSTGFSVLKDLFTGLLLFVASLGWGVTRPDLGRCLKLTIGTGSTVYFALDMTRELVLAFRHSHNTSIAFACFILAPVFVMNCGLLCAIFVALRREMRTLREQQEQQSTSEAATTQPRREPQHFDRLLLFQRLRCILVFCLIAVIATLVCRILALSRSVALQWESQWIWSDLCPELLALATHASMMYLWAPNKYSQNQTSRDSAVALLQVEPRAVMSREAVQDIPDAASAGGFAVEMQEAAANGGAAEQLADTVEESDAAGAAHQESRAKAEEMDQRQEEEEEEETFHDAEAEPCGL